MKFRNEFWFLSNMYPCSITYKGITYPCVETAFQAQKDESRSAEFIGLDGFNAKKLGRRVNLRTDWNAVRVSIMKELVACKFEQHPELADRLASVKGIIAEENTWHDTFWGVCDGKGRNELGNILMQIRKEITSCQRK